MSKKLVVEKYAKFHKYAKTKIFLPTTSKIWHKNMPVGNTAPKYTPIALSVKK